MPKGETSRPKNRKDRESKKSSERSENVRKAGHVIGRVNKATGGGVGKSGKIAKHLKERERI